MSGVEQSYCGCCGNETRGGPWCVRCLPHIAPAQADITGCTTPPWERTYFSQTGLTCPYDDRDDEWDEDDVEPCSICGSPYCAEMCDDLPFPDEDSPLFEVTA